MPAWATRGLAMLLLVGAVGLPWLATWRGVLQRPEIPQIVNEPTFTQYRPELVLVPGGKFRMGSTARERETFASPLPESLRSSMDDEDEHGAESAALYVCRTEVTRAQWRAVMGEMPEACALGCSDDHPVSYVNWDDACRFMIALTGQENAVRHQRGESPLTDCYRLDEERCTWSDPTCTGFRLPTETEWEYVARAGSTTAYSFGDDPANMCKHGNGVDLSSNSRYPERDRATEFGPAFDCDDGQPDLAPVGSFTANPWGLYDIHGNVSEWVWDWYSPRYKPTGVGNYAGPSGGTYRILRGGSFGSRPRGLRSATRIWSAGSIRDVSYGLRCVRSGPGSMIRVWSSSPS